MVGGLEPVVRAFLSAHIRSVADFLLLLAVATHADRWWDESSAALDVLDAAFAQPGCFCERLLR